jgi:hypothetical protein
VVDRKEEWMTAAIYIEVRKKGGRQPRSKTVSKIMVCTHSEIACCFLIQSEWLSKQFDHVHNFNSIFGIILSAELDEAEALGQKIFY